MSILIGTWNILATSYFGNSMRESSNLSRKDRIDILKNTLMKLIDFDILCFQEADEIELIKNIFSNTHIITYCVRPSKTDSCLICLKKIRFEVVEEKKIDLNRLACFEKNSDSNKINRFLRDNVAILLKVYDREQDKEFVLTTCHIYWNPKLPEVKFAQVKRILLECVYLSEYNLDTTFTSSSSSSNSTSTLPVIVTGDFNSSPYSDVYRLITSGSRRKIEDGMKINLEECEYSQVKESVSVEVLDTSPKEVIDQGLNAEEDKELFELCNRFRKQTLNQQINNSGDKDTVVEGPIRFLCDISLIKLCQWLRLLGYETTLMNIEKHPIFTSEEGKHLKLSDKKTIAINSYFEQCTREKRVLLTCSKNLLKRYNCPKAFYVNNYSRVAKLTPPSTIISSESPKETSENNSKSTKLIVGRSNQYLSEKDSELLLSLAAIFHEYDLPLDSSRFLTVCGFCGHSIQNCSNDDPRLKDKWIPGDRPVFICDNCEQSYYWNDCPTSSPALAMEKAFLLAEAISDSLSKRGIEGENEEKKSKIVWEKKSYTLTKEGVTFSNSDNSSLEPQLNIGNIYNNFSSLSPEERQKILSEKFEQRQQAIINKNSSTYSYSSNTIEGGQDNLVFKKKISVERLMKKLTKCKSLKLESVMHIFHGEEPKYTNRTEKFSGTLDYIFVSEDNVKVLDAFTLPYSLNYLKKNNTGEGKCKNSEKFQRLRDSLSLVDHEAFLPTAHWPSDHFLLVSEIKLL